MTGNRWIRLSAALGLATALGCVKGEQANQSADSTARNLTLAPTESTAAMRDVPAQNAPPAEPPKPPPPPKPAAPTSYTLSAAKMVHYPDDDTTLLTSPRLVSLGPTKAPVTITALQAVVSSNGEHVYFQDDVRVTRSAFGDSSELVMRTAFLHVVPDEKLAMTDRAVTITDAATTVTAVGFELNSETREIKLLSHVRGSYDPNKAPRGAAKR